MFHTQQSSELCSQLFRDKRDKFRFQMRKDRNESLFNQFRSNFIPNNKTFITTLYLDSVGSLLSLEEFDHLCQQIHLAYSQNEILLIESSLKALKEAFFMKNVPMGISQLLHIDVYQVLNEIISGQIDITQCPQTLEHALYIFIILSQLDLQDFEKVMSRELIGNLFVLMLSNQMNDKLFFIFEALSASCISDTYRDLIIKGDIVRKILDVLMRDDCFSDERLIQSIISLIKTLYLVKPLPAYEDLSFLLDPLLTLLDIRNGKIVHDILFILSKMASTNYEEFTKNCLSYPVFLDYLFEYLKSSDETVVDSSLNLVAALTFGDFDETFFLYERQIITQLMIIIINNKSTSNIIKKTLVIMGNFFDGDTRHVQVGIDHGFFENLLKIEENDYEIQREIIHCFVNASYVANVEQIKEFVKMGMIKKLTKFITTKDCEGELMIVILNGLENIAKNGFSEQGKNKFSQEMNDMQVKAMLENLLTHYDENVNYSASKLIEAYFI